MHIKNNSYLFISIFVMLLLSASACKKTNKISICHKQHCFFAELARTGTERSKGLMFRKDLAQNEGMLFVFEKEDIYPFWMKNTFIPLDIIWINSDKKVVFISKNTPICHEIACPNINPGIPAKYVLEINAGIADRIGLNIADKLDF